MPLRQRSPLSAPRLSRWLAAGAAVALAAVAAPSPPPAEAANGMKDLLRGLTTIAGAPKSGYPINNQVILVRWSELEPSRGSYNLNAIATPLAKARANGWNVKLRVMAGIRAPEWAKNIGGRPFAYRNGSGRTVGTIGRWWHPEYGAAYNRLMHRLASAYDDDPIVREVVLARCMTEFAEPLWREFSRQPANVRAARAAGYTDTADRECQRQQIVADGAPWRRTHVDLALTGAQYIDAQGRAYGDNQAPMANLALLQRTWGTKGIPGNNSLGADKARNRLYSHIAASSPPSTFQVQTYTKLQPSGVSGLLAALHVGCNLMKANSVELPTGYDNARPDQLQSYAAACARN